MNTQTASTCPQRVSHSLIPSRNRMTSGLDRRSAIIMAGITLMAFAATPAKAATYNWNGPNNALWSAGPWVDTVPSTGNVAVFSELGALGATVNLGATDITVAGLMFNTNVAGGNTIAAITVPATKLILEAGAAVTVDGTHTISAPLQLTAGTSTFPVAAAGKLTLSGGVTTSGANPSTTTIQKNGLGKLDITSAAFPGYVVGVSTVLRHVELNAGMVEIGPGANVNITRWLTQTANGYARQTGGTLSVDGWNDGGELNIGLAGNTFASYELKAGTINMQPGSWIQVGNGNPTRALLTIGDGTSTPAINISNGLLELGDNGSYGTVVHRSGTVFNDGVGADGFWGHLDVGVGNTGIYNQLGGTVTDTDGVALQLNPSATGIYNLNGGQLITKRVVGSGYFGNGPTANAFLNLNGGTLQALGNSADFLTARNPLTNPIGVTTTMYNGGGTIDTAGFNVTINKSILSPAGQGVAPITIALGGVGYRSAPVLEVVRDAGLPDITGTSATAVANMVDDGSGNGTYSIGSITVTCPGQNYNGTPTLNFVGGDPTTPATVNPLTLATNTGGTLTKQGAGTLTLSGTNTYAGDTVVQAGTLSLSPTVAGGYLADGADVKLYTGGILDLNTGAATDTVRSLYIDGVPQAAGEWGSAASGAANQSALFTGLGKLNVSTLGSVLTYSISGTVTLNGSGLSGVTVSDGTRTATTGGSGNYTITGVPDAATYTVTPSLGGYSFTPASASVPVMGVNVTNTNYTAAVAVSGYGTWAAANSISLIPSEDTNNDGVANGVAYFMNKTGLATNPDIDGTGKVTWPNGGNIPSSAYGTQFVVQTSSDLQTWTDVVGTGPSADPKLSNQSDSVSYTLTLTDPGPRFVRLKVTPN